VFEVSVVLSELVSCRNCSIGPSNDREEIATDQRRCIE
jgi:hypothetical protein